MHPVVGTFTVERPQQSPSTGIPQTLYLSDGIDTIPLHYNHPELPGLNTWSGCINRQTTGRVPTVQTGPFAGSGGCLGDSNGTDTSVSTTILYTLICSGQTGNRYRISLNTRLCGYNTPDGPRYKFQPGAPCDRDWAGNWGCTADTAGRSP